MFCNISKSEGPKPHGPSEKNENIFFISKWTNPRFSLELYLILHRKSMEKACFVHKYYFPMSLYSLLARISLGRKEVLRLHGESRQVRKGLEGEKKLEAIYPTTCNLGLIQFQTMDKWTEYVHLLCNKTFLLIARHCHSNWSAMPGKNSRGYCGDCYICRYTNRHIYTYRHQPEHRSRLQGCGRSTVWKHQNSVRGKVLFSNEPRVVDISRYMVKLVHSMCTEGNKWNFSDM